MPLATRAPARRDGVGAAVLDAAIRLLMAEFGDPTHAAPERGAHLFSFLSAAAVTRAATRLGPLRVTSAHLRDRWPTQLAYAEDLLSHGLAEHQRAEHPGALLRAAGTPGGAAGTGAAATGAVLAVVAEAAVQPPDRPVLTRLAVIARVLADRRPELRAALVTGWADADAAWEQWARGVLAASRTTTRAGVRLEDWTRSLQALVDGVRLQQLGTSTGTAHERRAAADLLARGLRALTCACLEPDAARGATTGATSGAPVAETRRPGPPPDPGRALHRLLDPATSTRRTERARRRLADDPVTAQLLRGGLAVLHDEFEPAGAAADRPSRFFDVLSVAALVREAGGEPSAAVNEHAVRSRWPHHDDLVEDLVGFALSPAHGAPAAERAARLGRALARGDDVAAAVRRACGEQLEDDLAATAYRVRMVATTLATARPPVRCAIADGYDRQAGRWAPLGERLLRATGRRRAAGTSADDAARLQVALHEGVVQRGLALGDDAVLDRGAGDSLLARATLLLLRGCSEPDRP